MELGRHWGVQYQAMEEKQTLAAGGGAEFLHMAPSSETANPEQRLLPAGTAAGEGCKEGARMKGRTSAGTRRTESPQQLQGRQDARRRRGAEGGRKPTAVAAGLAPYISTPLFNQDAFRED